MKIDKKILSICTHRHKLITYLILVLIAFLSISRIAEATTTIKVGVYDNKPLVFIDDTGKPRGIFIDILEHVAAKAHWEIAYIFGSWPECLDRLESGEIDLMTAIAYSDERAKKYKYTYETVITNWGQVFVPKNSKITSILDLNSKKIAVKMEDIHFYGLRQLTSKFNMECRFIESDGYDVVFELIEAGRVDAGVVNRLSGLQNKSSYPVQETTIMFNPIEVRFAAPKTSTLDLLSVIDIHLYRMQSEKDPFYTQTLSNWLVSPPEWNFPDPLKYTLIAVGLFLVFILAMNLMLRIKVKQRTEELSAANYKLQGEAKIRKNAEEELRKYEKIVGTSTDHMAMIDLNYSYQAVNDAALAALGKSRGDVIGEKTWDILTGISSKQNHKNNLDRAFSGQIVNHRTWMDFPDIGRRYMDIVYTPYKQPDNKIAGCVVNSRDITERHELELKLESAQKMEFMGTIAGGVAHDLNNILSGIVSYPELLLMQIPEDSPLAKPIHTIKKSGEKAAVIVQDLLTLARRGVANKQPVNLNEIITQFLNSPECKKIESFHANVQIVTVLSKQLDSIFGSSVHLSKTVMNLVSNAAESMQHGGKISIETRNIDLKDSIEPPEGDYVLLEISDTGMGISKEDLNKIFEPFYTKKVMGRSGTGLGLSVVWGTVMDHHGHIDVISDGKHGTTFKLLFPVSTEKAQSLSQEYDPKKYKGSGETILVVDDVEEQREIASQILTELGYNVETANSGEDAIAYLKNNTIDLVVLDMLMPPGMDGLSTYKQILNIRPGQKAIIASGFAETDRVKEALDLGVGKFIKKPYTIQDVGITVKKELAG